MICTCHTLTSEHIQYRVFLLLLLLLSLSLSFSALRLVEEEEEDERYQSHRRFPDDNHRNLLLRQSQKHHLFCIVLLSLHSLSLIINFSFFFFLPNEILFQFFGSPKHRNRQRLVEFARASISTDGQGSVLPLLTL